MKDLQRAAIAVGFVGLCACNDATAPAVQLTFCTAPEWVAVKTAGASAWALKTVTGKSVTVDATDKLSIAYSFSGRDVFIWSATLDELREMRFEVANLSCAKFDPAPKSVSGTVAGVPAGREYQVRTPTGPAAVSNGSTFTLALPDAPADLFAWTFNFSGASMERVIIRRDVNPANGAVLPVLDFGSAEAHALDSAGLTLSNVTATRPAIPMRFSTNLRTQDIALMLRSSSDTPLGFLHALPASLLGADEYHELFVSDCPPACRRLSYFYRSPQPISLALGPAASAAAVSVIDVNPCLRLRIDIPSQSEYPAFAYVQFAWGSGGSFREVYVGATRAFLGHTPGVWQLDVPALKRDDGTCLLDFAATSAVANYSVGDGRLAVFVGHAPGHDGEVVRAAIGTTRLP